MEWVSVAMAVAVMMVLPGLAGQWLDKRLGTGFLALVGFGVGVASGIYYLLAATARMSQPQSLKRPASDQPGGRESTASPGGPSTVHDPAREERTGDHSESEQP